MPASPPPFPSHRTSHRAVLAIVAVTIGAVLLLMAVGILAGTIASQATGGGSEPTLSSSSPADGPVATATADEVAEQLTDPGQSSRQP